MTPPPSPSHPGPPSPYHPGPPVFTGPPVVPGEELYGFPGSQGLAPDSQMSPVRGLSPTTTASKFKGDGPTHTLQLQLLRQSQKLRDMEASVNSSGYAAQRKKVVDLLAESERHFRFDNCDMAYEEDLVAQVEEAEDICLQKDGELDNARKAEKEKETRKKDLLAILPKGLGATFVGKALSWPSFRKQFLAIIASVEPTVAAATIKNLINCPKLKRSVRALKNGKEVLAELDKYLGHAFLNAQSRKSTTPELPQARLMRRT